MKPYSNLFSGIRLSITNSKKHYESRRIYCSNFKNQKWIITKKEDNGEFRLYESKNHGSSWEVVINQFVFQPIIDSASICFLSAQKIYGNTLHDVLVQFNRTTRDIIKEALPKSLEPYLLREYKGALFVAGVEAKGLSIYKRLKKNDFKLVYKFYLGSETFPKELHIFSHEWILLAGVRKSGYIENHLFRSKDNGMT